MLGPDFSKGRFPMDYPVTELSDLSYSNQPPVLIAASSARALSLAEQAVHAASQRIGARLGIEEASERLDRQAAASTLWVEIDEDGGGAMDDLLGRISSDVAYGRYAAIVSTTADLIDPVFSALSESEATLLVDAGGAERAAALALAMNAPRPTRLSDVAADQSSARLRQLSDEVNRIAATLARLSAAPSIAPEPPAPAANAAEPPAVAPETVRSIIRARRLRNRFFPEDLFADPAWDMLLDLLQAELSHLRVPVSSLCIAAAVPATTALRWLKSMVDQGLFVRRADPHDGRRVFVELSRDTSLALRRYFAEVERTPVV